MRLSISEVADKTLLKKVWKEEVRQSLRSMTLKNFNLVPDPIHYAGYEWGLDAVIAALVRDLQLGRYAPERSEIVRTAKSKGLSRPLCFLATRDALIYRTITWLVQDRLVENAPDWVGFSRSDKGSRKHGVVDPGQAKAEQSSSEQGQDSFDWFRFWLAREGHILKMVEDEYVQYFVESDIANFFPSIRIEAVREHLHSHTDLEKEVVRLCVQIIDGVMPRTDYSEVSLMGLPQEQIGSSRAIAHSLLEHVDEEFANEGEAGRYARYMDDIIIGVCDVAEGERCIARLQRSLEVLGLYPNSSKTVISTVNDYLDNAMVESNGEIERLEVQLEATKMTNAPHVPEPNDVLKKEIVKFSDAHRAIANRPRRWGRVTRRIYTLHRNSGVQEWWNSWRSDIDEDPGAAAQILEYVRSWPLTSRTVEDLARLSADFDTLYADIPLLAAEVVVSAPNPNDESAWNQTYTLCLSEFGRIMKCSPQTPDIERLGAAWLLAAWKFGNLAQRQHLLSLVADTSDAISAVRAQALPLLVAGGSSISEWVAAKPGLAWENALAAEYLRSLNDGEERAVGVALSLLNPALRLNPQRFTMLPRTLPLVEILGRSAFKKITAAAPRIISTLQKNPDRLRDHRIEFMLSQWRL